MRAVFTTVIFAQSVIPKATQLEPAIRSAIMHQGSKLSLTEINCVNINVAQSGFTTYMHAKKIEGGFHEKAGRRRAGNLSTVITRHLGLTDYCPEGNWDDHFA